MRRAVALVLSLAAACGVVLWPEVVCDERQLGGMRCDEVVDAAATQLGDVGQISRLTVAPGVPCPIDEAVSCPDVPRGSLATVYADLADGRRLAVPVTIADDGDGSLHAGPPQEMRPAP